MQAWTEWEAVNLLASPVTALQKQVPVLLLSHSLRFNYRQFMTSFVQPCNFIQKAAIARTGSVLLLDQLEPNNLIPGVRFHFGSTGTQIWKSLELACWKWLCRLQTQLPVKRTECQKTSMIGELKQNWKIIVFSVVFFVVFPFCLWFSVSVLTLRLPNKLRGSHVVFFPVKEDELFLHGLLGFCSLSLVDRSEMFPHTWLLTLS